MTRDGQVRAGGRPYDHATLGPLEDWLDAQAGPGVISGIAERAALDGKHVRGWYRRLLPADFMMSERACLDWRKALGPAPLEELEAAVLAAAAGEHAERPGQSLTIGKSRPLAVHPADGSVLRVPDTPENRAEFGSVGTADDSAAWPAVRLYPLNNCLTRSLLTMTWGPAGDRQDRLRAGAP